MATTYTEKQLVGTGTITTYTNIYNTAATGTVTAIISSLTICNETTSAITVRVGISATNGTTAPGTGKWLVYDRSIPANETIILAAGWALSNGKYLNASSSNAGITFTASVAEIS